MKILHTPFMFLSFFLFVGLFTIAHAEMGKEVPATQKDLTAAKEWHLKQIGDDAVAAKAGVTLVFSEENKLSGSGGVNRYGGEYELQADGQIAIQKIISTQRAAMDEVVMKRENRLFQLLGKARRTFLSEGNLVVECADKEDKSIKLVFVAVKKK